MPALAASQEMQERAADLGYDWPSIDGVLDKVEEELGELAPADDEAERREEFGDLLMVAVNLARKHGIDAEAALRAANAKFRASSRSVERLAAERGVALRDLTFDELDAPLGCRQGRDGQHRETTIRRPPMSIGNRPHASAPMAAVRATFDRSRSGSASRSGPRARASSGSATPRSCARRRSRTGCRPTCAARAPAGSRPSTRCSPAPPPNGPSASRLSGKVGGRTHEIQRLVGRSLRGVVDLTRLGERTVTVDCDVLQADGGTRTASITGGYVALAAALITYGMERLLVTKVAAVSVGIVDGIALLDLDYPEDSQAEVDFNVVGTDAGTYVELQGTAEGKPFDRAAVDSLLDLANAGLAQLFTAQAEILATVPR